MSSLQRSERQQPEDDLGRAGSSRLLGLSTQLRLIIWNLVFTSTALAYTGKCANNSYKKAPATSLALLYVCRQIRNDIETSWIGQVMFDFETLEAMLHTLSPVPSTTVSRIRRLKLHKAWFALLWEDDLEYFKSEDDGMLFNAVADAFKLLPSLGLDTLFVEGNIPWETDEPWGTWRCIEKLFHAGNGWEELHFSIFTSSPVLFRWKVRGSLPEDPRSRLFPVFWMAFYPLIRDGEESGSYVTAYRISDSIKATPPAWGVSWPQEGELVELDPTLEEAHLKDKEAIDEEDREGFLFVVKRGPAVDITERGSPPFDKYDIRTHGTTWEEVTKNCWSSWYGPLESFEFGIGQRDG